jgi:hypothetical protein
MRTRHVIALIAAIAGGAFANQDSLSDDAALDAGAFDRSLTAGKAVDRTNKLEYLPGASFVSEADGYLPESGGYGADERFYGKAFLKATKADLGSLYAGCNFTYFLYAAANNEFFRAFYQAQSPDPSSISAALSEAHFSFDIRKRVFVRVGQQLIKWGASYFWTPEDFINLQRAQATVLSPVDVRVGKPGLRIHVPIRSANLFLFTDFSAVTRNKIAGDLAHEVAQAWRLDGTIAGVNIGTVGYVSKKGPTHIGLDATGNLLATDVYGELALTFQRNTSAAYAFSLGAARPFGQEKNWTVRGEFYYNDTGYGDTGLSRTTPGSFTPFYSGKYYAYAELSGTGLLKSTFGVSLFGIMNLADLSYSPTLQCSFDLPRIVPFSLYARYFGGRKNRELTSAFGGSGWQLGLRIVVEL